MDSMLQRLVSFAKKTGDRLIIHDAQSNTSVVLMDIAQYEQLRDLRDVTRFTSEELLERINDDIALWREIRTKEEEQTRDSLLTEELEEEDVGHMSPIRPVEEEPIFLEEPV